MKNLKKLLVSLLTLALLICTVAPAMVFAEEAGMTIGIVAVDAKPGQEVDVQIAFTNQTTGIGGYQFDIAFDAAKLEYVKSTSNTEFSGTEEDLSISLINDTQANTGKLIYGGCTTKDFVYTAPIVTLTFKVLDADATVDTPITLSNLDITTVEGTAVECTPVENNVHIIVKHITGIELSATSAVIGVNGTTELTCTILPADYTDEAEVVWSTSDAEVASVENGVVTGLRAGTATIKATVAGFEATCTVYVAEYALDKTALNLKVGDSEEVAVVITPETTPVTEANCSSANEEVATVAVSDNGYAVTAVGVGETTITITINGNALECAVVVEAAYMKGDFDNDGSITVADALAALRIGAKLVEETSEYIAIGDVDNDGHVTVADALAILRVAARLVDHF